MTGLGGRSGYCLLGRLRREAVACAAIAIAATFVALTLAAGTAQARSCVDDTIRTKSDDGTILVMMSGAVYQVVAGDNIDSMLWLPGDAALICGDSVVYGGRKLMFDEIINTDEGEKVDAERLR